MKVVRDLGGGLPVVVMAGEDRGDVAGVAPASGVAFADRGRYP